MIEKFKIRSKVDKTKNIENWTLSNNGETVSLMRDDEKVLVFDKN